MSSWCCLLISAVFILCGLSITWDAWNAARGRQLEIIEPWKHHRDLLELLGEAMEKLNAAVLFSVASLVLWPAKRTVLGLLFCVSIWIVHVWFHLPLIT